MHDTLDKQKLLDLMRAEYTFTQRTLALVPPDRLTEPHVLGEWSVKDMLAHLVAWQRQAFTWIETARRGEGERGAHPREPLPGFQWNQEDAMNEQIYQQNKDRSWDELLAEFQQTYKQILAATEALAEDELFGRSGLGAFFRDPLWQYIVYNTYEHYQEHTKPLRQWLQQRIVETSESRAIKVD